MILNKFTYALSEYTDVKGKKFIANPGCYATATELALIPLVAAGLIETDSIIVDAKSGLTGAGKALSESSHFVNVHDNYMTYKLNHHQHIPEIVQTLQALMLICRRFSFQRRFYRLIVESWLQFIAN